MTKRIMLLGGGMNQVRAAIIAEEIGLDTILMDPNPKCPAADYASKPHESDVTFVQGDYRDIEAAITVGQAHHIDGVMTHGQEIPFQVASIAQVLGLPGISPQVAFTATNKLARAEALTKGGVNYPKFGSASTYKEAADVAEYCGYPVVVKPVDNAGALGISMVREPHKIGEAFEHARNNSAGSVVLIERYLEGKELSTEGVMINGKFHHTAFADRNYKEKFRFFPSIIENGGECPSQMDESMLRLVRSELELAAMKLGIENGVVKGDVLIDVKPYILEIAVRTSGGRFADTVAPLATGVNILYSLLNMAVGNPLDLSQLEPTCHKAAATRYLFPRPGTVVSIEGIEDAQRLPGVELVYIKPEILQRGPDMSTSEGRITYIMGTQAGKQISPPRIPQVRSFGDRVGYVIAQGDNVKQAIARAEAGVSVINIQTR